MITHINDRLNQWALWRMGASMGKSRTGRSPYPAYNLGGGDGWGDGGERRSFVPINDIECCDTDRCVVALDPVLRQAVEAFYLETGTHEQMAQTCGCGRATLFRRVHEAHVEIMASLNDLSAGIMVVSWELKRLTA